MKNLPHPRRLLLQEILQPLGLTVAPDAMGPRVSRRALDNLVGERAGISPEMAARLAKAFRVSAQIWLRMQSN